MSACSDQHLNPIDVEFYSNHEKCSAYLYRPNTLTPSPIIIMAHGLGGTKRMRLTAFAERFVVEGYACLLFDYCHFGESEGQPRQLLDINRQLTDWKSAIAYARTLENIDKNKIILWGTSFSGGHVLKLAAEDHNISAVISQCPFTNGISSSLAIPIGISAKLSILAIRDRLGSLLNREPIMVKVAGHPNTTALMTAPDAYDGYLSLAKDLPDFKNYIAARFTLDIIRYFPGYYSPKIKAPVLFCICEKDSVAPSKTTIRHAQQTPKKNIIKYSYGHFEIYTGLAFEHVLKDQINFLKQTVPTTIQ